MPYTPPGQQSPAASRSETLTQARDGSWVKSLPPSSPFVSGPRPSLPRSSSSTSYLHRHRRSPSSQISLPSPNLSFERRQDDSYGMNDGKVGPKVSLRHSPPPMHNLTILPGAVVSPPDSGQSSSDDDLLMMARGRKLSDLAELQAAISVIEQQREGSPASREKEVNKKKASFGVFDSSADSGLKVDNSAKALTKEAKKISHSRSVTEPTAHFNLGQQQHSHSPSRTSSDDDSDGTPGFKKPPMLRKKSGELIRPALRPSSGRRRPSSMPGTPTFGKAVHFSSNLEHVKHFKQVDRPLAVSAGTSPTENYDTDTEFPFGDNDLTSRPAATEWEIRLANFPTEVAMAERKLAPVLVERVYMSSDKKTLIGGVAVQNLAFHKLVVARFTFDYWKTTSEVVAEYNNDVRHQGASGGCDRFNFNIKLEDQTNLENKTLFFCVRYNVSGHEYWDSNNMMNYKIEFTKKAISATQSNQSAPAGSAMLHSLPRCHNPPKSAQVAARKPSIDDFGKGFDSHWDSDLLPRSASASHLLGEKKTPLRFRSKAAGNALEDTQGRSLDGPGQTFGNRYDFGASLSAAMSTANTVLGERSGFSPPDKAQRSPKLANGAYRSINGLSSSGLAAPPSTEAATQANSPTPAALDTGKPSMQSQSYTDLLDKYCFFGSAPKAPPQLHKRGKGQLDGSDGSPIENDSSCSSTPSPQPSPPPANVAQKQEASSSGFSRSGTASPVTGQDYGPRTSSPAFGYSYHNPMSNGLTPSTAIKG